MLSGKHGRRGVAYSIKAVDLNGQIVQVAVVDTAKQAMSKYLDALEVHHRAWVLDESNGADLNIDQLAWLATLEDRNA
jgi:hypothetical protein